MSRLGTLLELTDDKFIIHQIKSIDGRSLWCLFKEYIINLEIGHVFTRKELLNAIYSKKSVVIINDGNSKTTIDTYRNRCSHVGILSSPSKGKFIKEFNIPENTTSTMMAKHCQRYTKSSWKQWFIPPIVRVKALHAEYENVR